MTVQNCRFENCKVPLSFLLITENCVFTDCRLEDGNAEKNEIKEPIEVIYYASGTTNAIHKRPETVTLIEKPPSALIEPVGSILSENSD